MPDKRLPKRFPDIPAVFRGDILHFAQCKKLFPGRKWESSLYQRLTAFVPEDVGQVGSIVLWRMKDNRISYDEAVSEFHREMWDLGKKYNMTGQWGKGSDVVASDMEKACQAPECKLHGAYRDPDWGRLCRKHGSVVRKRRERGQDPLKPFQDRRGRKSLPPQNREFWQKVRELLSVEEWDQCWIWARSRRRAVPEYVQTAHERLFSAEIKKSTEAGEETLADLMVIG